MAKTMIIIVVVVVIVVVLVVVVVVVVVVLVMVVVVLVMIVMIIILTVGENFYLTFGGILTIDINLTVGVILTVANGLVDITVVISLVHVVLSSAGHICSLRSPDTIEGRRGCR
ncbi:hypothetical protein KDK_37150 [Dictyobacter kobayashii]|uniref:Uncharacterized protein n=1 Tax=Dictyobacter kobayashii TaxID=2014872 RepID=A0A402ALK0_9CHLR|nr:hypothetical protein KDK_37150 [Dictyobacter kobayashii]